MQVNLQQDAIERRPTIEDLESKFTALDGYVTVKAFGGLQKIVSTKSDSITCDEVRLTTDSLVFQNNRITEKVEDHYRRIEKLKDTITDMQKRFKERTEELENSIRVQEKGLGNLSKALHSFDLKYTNQLNDYKNEVSNNMAALASKRDLQKLYGQLDGKASHKELKEYKDHI